MAVVNINTVIARYQGAFGYVGGNLSNAAFGRLVRLPVYANNDNDPGSDQPVQLYPVNEITFANVVFTNNKSEKVYAFGLAAENSETEYMAPPLMVSFSRGKNVVRTAIDRSETEVIEHFGLKPWSINIQGILIDQENRQYPQALLKKLNEMFSAWGTYKVSGDLFLDLEITEVFFDDDFQIGFVEGFADTVKFSVRAISVLPLEIRAMGGGNV